jgi:hypothetical protein
MGAVSHIRANAPKFQPGQLAGKKASGAPTKRDICLQNQNLPNTDQLAGINWTGLLKKLWPSKPSLELSIATGCSQRHAERVLSGARGLSAESLIAILRSAHGLSALKELMIGNDEPWWRDVQRAMELADIERRQAALRRQLEDDARTR